MRGATCQRKIILRVRKHFNPRSSCEERLARHAIEVTADDISIHAPHARSDYQASAPGMDYASISIHAPHARSDCTRARSSASSINFNPRSSCEERPRRHLSSCHLAISIHAPHARSDPGLHMSPATLWHFNPRSSCEERPSLSLFLFILYRFQSTLLMRGATRWSQLPFRHSLFQSTLLMRGATIVLHRVGLCVSYFNPRSSCEERRYCTIFFHSKPIFQSTLLMRGATKSYCNAAKSQIISIHAPHARSDVCPLVRIIWL